ncbi:hypothetical protein [Jatrophihabitans fulvus]
MRRHLTPISLLTSLVTAAAGLTLATATDAAAAATCTYKPVLPKRVVVGQTVVGLRVPLSVVGPAACRNDNMSASTQLVRGKDSYFLSWLFSTAPDTQSVYAFTIVPGTYRTTASTCSAYDADYNALSCTMTAASTVIKFGGKPRLTASRSGSKVKLHARAARFDDFDDTKAVTAPVALQQLNAKGKWVTLRRATATASRGYTWTFNRTKKYRYRIVQREVGSTFGANSRSVVK